ncbi:MAG TPA: ABC transporter permease [Acidimicrobiales bacterium]|nr:ABC transporter permease [Acidimicrobiales bacterium]
MTATATAVEREHPEPEAEVHRDHTGSSLRELLGDTFVYAGRNIEHIKQIPEKLLDVTLQPLMFVLLFAFVFGGAIAVNGSNYREYIIGGILMQSLAFGMVGPATAIATDLTEGVIDRFRSLPASRLAYLLGHYTAELAGMLLSIVVLLAAGLAVGWRAHTGPIRIGAAVVLLIAFASSMIWVGTWIGLKVRAPDAVMGVAFVIIFPLTFVSNAFVPIATLPTVLQWFASWNPISVMVSAVRELFGNPSAPLANPSIPLRHPVPWAFIYCAVILAVTVPATIRRYRARTSD